MKYRVLQNNYCNTFVAFFIKIPLQLYWRIFFVTPRTCNDEQCHSKIDVKIILVKSYN